MIIYVLVGLLSLISFSLTRHNGNIIVNRGLCIIFILFTGLSYTNGWDWYGYRDYYNYIQNIIDNKEIDTIIKDNILIKVKKRL